MAVPFLKKEMNLKYRQMVVVIAVSLIILLLTTAVFFFNDYVSFKRRIQENIQSHASFIATNSLSAVEAKDKPEAEQVLTVAGLDKNIESVVLFGTDKTPIAEYRRPGISEVSLPKELQTTKVLFNHEQASIVLPLNESETPAGWLYLVYDLSVLNQKIGVYAKVALGIFAIGLMLAWVMSSFAQKFVAEPIAQLAALIEKISRTKNYSERMHISRNDELGLLINGFNNMLAAIQERETELQRHGERLESLVELRTQQLHHRANYDALTRLPNRYLLMEKLHQSIESARRTQRNMALLLIDLDRFKIINDSLGHHVGDELLQVLSKRLSSISRIDDSVGRLGGDEFVILLGNVTDPEDAEVVAKKVMAELSEPFVLQHHRLHISASIGISVFPKDSEDALGLLRRADVSMYRSKQDSKSSYSFYDSDLDNNDSRLAMESKLRSAVANNEIYMVYQPQAYLKSQSIIGAEALMRWHNPELGEIHPAEFIPVASEVGLINELTKWAIESVCKQQKVWRDLNVKPIKTAINISATDLLVLDFVTHVKSCIEKYEVDPSYIELEITEDVFLERAEQIFNTLYELKGLGLAIAIDDFGTGYSSLSYLRDFPVDVLKLDGSFVQRINESGKSQGIVSSAIALAHGLGLEIVAECVETQSQFDFLLQHDCDIIQGNYFSGPLTGDALAVFLNQHDQILTTAVAL